MSDELATVIRAARAGFLTEEAAVASVAESQLRMVYSKTATGTGDIAQAFQIARLFRLVFVRCHFSGGTGTADLVLSIDHGGGPAFDTRLATVVAVGTGTDVHFQVSSSAEGSPSPWTFQSGDALRVDWINPDSGNMTWGLEVGLAPAWQPALRTATA